LNYLEKEKFFDNIQSLLSESKNKLASKLLNTYLNSDPYCSKGLNIYAQLNLLEGNQNKAEDLFNKSLIQDPKNLNSLFNLAKIEIQRDNFVNAKIFVKKCLEIDNENHVFHNYLGAVYLKLNKIKQSLDEFYRSIAIEPHNYRAYANMSSAYLCIGKYKKAISCIDKAFKFNNSPEYLKRKASIFLLLRNFKEGWELYENRKHSPLTMNRYIHDEKLWDGKRSLEGKRIFIYMEQGLGDIIQFSRCLKLIDLFNVKVIFLVPKTLITLFSSLDEKITLIDKDDPIPDYDFQVPIMSLPYLQGLSLDISPVDVPYLYPNITKVSLWKKGFNNQRKLKIGFAFSGRKTHPDNSNRSIRIQEFVSILDDRFDWHLLQNEISIEEKTILLEHKNIYTHEENLDSMDDTAALISCMDIVISVDTSIVHLTGALNIPVWVLLPFNPDFRWMLERNDAPWYPSATLYRQRLQGNWKQVFEDIHTSLNQMI